MSSSNTNPSQPHDDKPHEEEESYLDAGEVGEEIEVDDDDDQHMEDASDDEAAENHTIEQELVFENNSSAHFDHHTDSLFCIAQHPRHPQIVLTGSGDDTALVFDAEDSNRPLLPSSYETAPQQPRERESLGVLAKFDGHDDSVNAVTFTQPEGEYAVTAGLDGKLRVWRDTTDGLTGRAWAFLGEAQEVEEVDWIAACPATLASDEPHHNVVALGASNGSVWVYRIDKDDKSDPVCMMQVFFQHTVPCTAGAWTPDGNLLATVAEDGSFYVYDVFGAAAAAGVASSAGAQTVVGMTADDQRFAVAGGLYAVAISPTGAIAAVGGAEGHIKIVGLPRIAAQPAQSSKPKGKAKGGATTSSAGGSAGMLLASLQAQSDGVETLSFSSAPLNLLAAGSVDGSIALFDTSHRFAVRRHIRGAHEENAVVKVEFVHNDDTQTTPGRPWLLTSVGMDGVVRRWDARGGTTAAGHGLLKEWKGHMGMTENEEGERSGGILGFVQGPDGKRIVTAGDDGIALVFDE